MIGYLCSFCWSLGVALIRSLTGEFWMSMSASMLNTRNLSRDTWAEVCWPITEKVNSISHCRQHYVLIRNVFVTDWLFQPTHWKLPTFGDIVLISSIICVLTGKVLRGRRSFSSFTLMIISIITVWPPPPSPYTGLHTQKVYTHSGTSPMKIPLLSAHAYMHFAW